MGNWLYFGCNGGPGHYLWEVGMIQVNGRVYGGLPRDFDGLLAPQNNRKPYIAAVSRLEGWGLSALSFWDYSVDKRQGSNSIIFAPSLTITPDEFLSEAKRRFPQVFSRIPGDVVLMDEVNRGQ